MVIEAKSDMTPNKTNKDDSDDSKDEIKTWPLHEWSFTPPWSNDDLMTKNAEELEQLRNERFMGDNQAMIDYLLGKTKKKDDDAK